MIMNHIQTTLTLFGYIGVAAPALVAINNPKPTVATESSPVVYSDRIETTTFMDQTITVNCTDPQMMGEDDGIWLTRDDMIRYSGREYGTSIFDGVYNEACN
jgi:hypothetical protein